MSDTMIKFFIWMAWVVCVLLIPWLLTSFVTMEPWALFTAPNAERGVYLAVVTLLGICTWIIPALQCDKVYRWR